MHLNLLIAVEASEAIDMVSQLFTYESKDERTLRQFAAIALLNNGSRYM